MPESAPQKPGWLSRCALRVGALLVLATTPAWAQGTVTGTLVTPNPTASIADLQTRPSWAFLTLTNSTGEDLQVQVSASLSRNGGDVLVAQLGPATPPFLTIPGTTTPQVSMIPAPRIAPWSLFSYIGSAGSQVHDTGRLPDGDWTLCVTLTGVTGVQTQRSYPDIISCSTFIIRFPEAPRLLLPVDRMAVTLPNPVFQWTPVTGVPGVTYRFRLVEMLGGQTSREALEADRPVFETFLSQRTALLYPPAAYPLRAGSCYAWQVQSVTLQGSDVQPVLAPVGTNQGRSQIYTFCYQPPRTALLPDTLPADSSAGAGIALGVPAAGAYGLLSSPTPAPPLTASGSISAYGELYDLSGSAGTAARPDQTGRLQVNTTLSMANGLVQVPVQAIISTDQVSFRQEINQLGVSPTWRDYVLHAGYYTPRFTDLTLSDATLLGGGIEGHPGRWRFDGGYGRARRAIHPTMGQFVQPEFTRWMGIGRLGYEAPSGMLAELTLVSASDDAGSLGMFGDTTAAASPQQDLVLGLHGKVPFSARRLWLELEGTRSSYKADKRAAFDAVRDYAGAVGLSWQAPAWSLGGRVTYVGPDYHALGNTQLQSDQIRYEATGQLHRGTLSLGLQAGLQQNNLDNTLQSTTTMRGIYSLTASWQATTAFGLDGSASNIVNNVESNDPMLALRNVNQSYTLTPRLTWQTGAEQHVLAASGTWQTADNSSPGITGLQDTRTGSAMFSYTLAFPSGISLTTTGTFTQVKVDSLETNLSTLYPALALPFFQGRLNTMLGLQWTWSGIAGTDLDTELYPQLNASFAVTPRQQVTLVVTHRHYAYGTAMPGSAFNETVGSLEYRYSF